jgi:subtilisin family serine protease
VKVLDCNGNGSYSGIIKGVDWVTANAVKPAVANMSLGGGASQALDDAVRKSAAGGVFYSLAAGNEGADACKSSPARVGAGTDNGIATVAATNKQDAETSWSNYGRCVDIWAPGTGILSTKKGGGTFTIGGTSMAAPHVGGGAALYLSKNTAASPAAVEGALTSSASATTTANTSWDGAAIWARIRPRLLARDLVQASVYYGWVTLARPFLLLCLPEYVGRRLLGSLAAGASEFAKKSF